MAERHLLLRWNLDDCSTNTATHIDAAVTMLPHNDGTGWLPCTKTSRSQPALLGDLSSRSTNEFKNCQSSSSKTMHHYKIINNDHLMEIQPQQSMAKRSCLVKRSLVLPLYY